MLDTATESPLYDRAHPPMSIAHASARMRALKHLWRTSSEYRFVKAWRAKQNIARTDWCYELLMDRNAKPTALQLLEAVYLIAACRVKLRFLDERELDLRHKIKVRLNREHPMAGREYPESTLDLIDDALEHLVPKANLGQKQIDLMDFADDLLQTMD